MISPARTAAFDILSKVELRKGHSDDLLHTAAVDALSPEDRNLATALVMDTLRWQLALDSILRGLSQRPFQETPPAAILAMRLGALQLLRMDRIPPHAALNESVELARANGATHATGMVNAILRRITRERDQLLPKLTAEAAHPQWLLDRWRGFYGAQNTAQIAKADQSLPNESALFLNSDAPQMDAGSRLVAELAAASVAEPQRILDTCAAPGGKTIVLARRHPGATIVAADSNPKRLEYLRRRIEHEGISNVECVEADMTQTQPWQPFDLILCDAPCSGTGTLARNPEVRIHLRPDDLKIQSRRQRAILANALTLLATNGRALYSTCSLELEENEDVVSTVLQATEIKTRQLELTRPLQSLADKQLSAATVADLKSTALRGTTLRTLPGVHAMDGFYAALIARKS